MEEIKNNFDKYYDEVIGMTSFSGKKSEAEKEILRFLLKEGIKGLNFSEMIDILDSCKSSIFKFIPSIIEI